LSQVHSTVAQVRVAPQRARQLGAGGGEAVALVLAAVPVPGLVHVEAQHFVARLVGTANLGEVRHAGHRVRRVERLDAGVELPLARAPGRHRSGHARFQATDDAARVAQQLEEEGLVVDAQVLLFDQRTRQTGELGQALFDARARLAIEPRAGVQGHQVVLVDEGLGRGTRRLG
jgi:hypothetical protein